MLSIIIPVYNEAESLPHLFRKLTATLNAIGRPWEAIFVNDGSRDESAAILNTAAANQPLFKVIHFRRNYGQTAAMMAGIDYASGSIIIPMDADLQNDSADIPNLLAKLDEGYDVCSGWRVDRQDAAVRRRLPSQVANWLISRVSGVKLHDYGCSLKAYKRDVIKDIRLYGEMHRFIPIYASWHGARVTEIPVTHHARQYGQSKYGLGRVFKVTLDLIVVKFLDKYHQKPIYVFGAVGALNFVVAVVSGLLALYLKLFRDVAFVQTPLPLLVVMTAIMGMMCILMGLLAEMITRTWHESQGKSIYLVGSTCNLPPLPIPEATSIPVRPQVVSSASV